MSVSRVYHLLCFFLCFVVMSVKKKFLSTVEIEALLLESDDDEDSVMIKHADKMEIFC